MNAAAAGLEDQIDVREASIDQALYTFETFDLVIADPPWVPSADIGEYPGDPELAIDGGDDGLAVTWPCVQAARMHLAVGGAMVLQLGTTAQVDRARSTVTSGARRKTALSAPAGMIGSLKTNFKRSAKDWKRPKGPTTFGPRRSCTAAQILRSANRM